jgi:hypothetical protein
MVAPASSEANTAQQWIAASTPSPSYICSISYSWILFIMDIFYLQ